MGGTFTVMIEYIERDAALTFEKSVELAPEDLAAFMEGMAYYADHIKNLPVADVRPVKRGRWVCFPECLAYDGAYSGDDIVCSVCGECFNIMDNDTERFYYCPNCGAEMTDDEEKS